ncbi:hypothetical protein C900_01699 [Fulvivirga imtechensis AK7]|uniref:Uncharacterized protein n=1 Tax=Fulvivirga imtechensis AK7 TaxID=1237149 RepID=L8JXE7_9BACT|nr:hypothetical protein C900_01699 [Fulvivirga imtechensis AK7]
MLFSAPDFLFEFSIIKIFNVLFCIIFAVELKVHFDILIFKGSK